MSTIKSVYLQHLNGTIPNATMDTNGNFTVGGTVSGASSNMFRNRIINGDMRIDQRYSGSATANTISSNVVDRWYVLQSTTGKLIAQQNAGSVTPPAGFTNYLGVTSQSSYSIGSSDYYCLGQIIEGYNIADLGWGTANAKTVTLSFWVRSSLTGTFGAVIQNSPNNYDYPFTYTINSSNTWEYKTVTISGPTTGTFNTTNTAGCAIYFGLGVGSTYSGTAGSWSNGLYISATGATSIVGTSGATFYITGVQFEVGTAATPFEFRQYGHEIALCQRYYQPRSTSVYDYPLGMFGYAYGSARGAMCVPLTVPMRAVPTWNGLSSTTRVYGNGTQTTISAVNALYYTLNNCVVIIDISLSSNMTSNHVFVVTDSNLAGSAPWGFALDAEL